MRALQRMVAGCFVFALLASAVQAQVKGPPVLRSAKSGNWSDGTTWEGGKSPAAGARVQVREGHTVVYDAASSEVIRSIHVAGALTFSRQRSTRLVTGLIKIQPGEDASEDGFDCDGHVMELAPGKARPALEVGTPDEPIPSMITAHIALKYVEGLDKVSCPAIVCCGGRMDFHGAPMPRTWLRLAQTAKAGAAAVTLESEPKGWKVGDRLVVTATKGETGDIQSEEVTVKAIEGSKLTIEPALKFDHRGEGEFRGEVANLSRNVVVESAEPEGNRGHTMYHRGSAGSLSYTEFRHLGKKDTLGRYSLHFHLCGDTMRGSYVQGCSIWDSHNRWLTIHGTNYLVVRDNVGYKSIGHGFFLEDGTEVYNVLDRNLAIRAMRGKRLPKQVLPFDANDGAGYWWANSLNTFTRNVAVENDRYGFRFEATQGSQLKLTLPVRQPDGSRKPVDIRTLPFVRFDDNECHCDGLYGFNLGEGVARVGPDAKHPFVIRNMKIWEVHYGFRVQSPSVLVENLKLHRAAYGVYHPNYDDHVFKNLYIAESVTEPFNRGHDDLSMQFGRLAVDGLTFDNIRSGGMPLVQISDHNPSGNAVTHIRNLKVENWKPTKGSAIVNLGGGPRPQPKTEVGVPIYIHDYFGPGRHAMVVSTRSPEFKKEPDAFRAEPKLTGDESRVKEVKDVEFPKLLDPIDDLPPQTVITHQVRTPDGKLHVRGTAADNGTIVRVVVNGQTAKALEPNFAQWAVEVPQAKEIRAYAEDAAGNIEVTPHVR
jgi:hypothetical protein